MVSSALINSNENFHYQSSHTVKDNGSEIIFNTTTGYSIEETYDLADPSSTERARPIGQDYFNFLINNQMIDSDLARHAYKMSKLK